MVTTNTYATNFTCLVPKPPKGSKMSNTKESTATLPRTSRRLESINAHPGTRKQLPALPESSQQSSNKIVPERGSGHDFVTKYNIKRLTCWFKTWRTWQRRIFTCRVMEHCSKQHLELLATSLEPVLHFDFSSSFSAPLQSLHLDSMATFQVHRTILQSIVNPQILEASDSLSHLPTSLSSTESATSSDTVLKKSSSHNQHHSYHQISESVAASSNKEISKECSKSFNKVRETILPALPLIHLQHAQDLSSEQHSASIEDLVTIQRKHFSSIPDFKSTTDLLRTIRQNDRVFNHSKPRRHRRARTIGTYPVLVKTRGEERRKAELFKEQLATASNWMRKWKKSQTCVLLLEVIKLCDKELLGYFVQCLYQRLRDKVSIDSLQDSILLKIFSYLDPKTLCKCAQVSRRWKRLSETPSLWREMSRLLGRHEGVGDLASAVETAASSYMIPGVVSDASVGSQGSRESKDAEVDWKKAYQGLSRVMHQIKDLVVKAARAAEQQELVDARAMFNPTSAVIRSKFSLREMLQILQSRLEPPGSVGTTQELLQLALESAAAMRRRLRAERKAAAESAQREEEERRHSSKYEHRRPQLRGATSSRMTPLFGSSAGWSSRRPSMMHQLMSQIAEKGEKPVSFEEEWQQRMSVLELIDVAIDMRPAVPYLPNADGIRCLILADLLMSGEAPKPGRVQPIPKLRRLKQFNSTVLCLQSDSQKIVMGTDEREIIIHDIRSGRYVETLTGHKGSVQCLQFDNYKIVSGSWDTSVIVWDVVHFNALNELNGHADCVSCLQFDEEKLITGSFDQSLRVWSTSTWECITVIGSAHKGPITCLQFNKSLLASGGMDKCVKLWSISGYHCLATLGHPAPISTLKLSNLLLISAIATAVSDVSPPCTSFPDNNVDSIHLWNLHTNTEMMTWPVSGHGAFITSFASNGSRVYGGGSDGALYEWDISTGTCVRTLISHSRGINFVYARDQRIITAAGDYTVCMWHTKKPMITDLYNDNTFMEEEDTDYVDIPIKVVTQSDIAAS